MVENINTIFKVCQRQKKLKLKSVVSCVLAKKINETVTLDLKQWKSNPKVWFLHIIDHLTQFSASCVIEAKRKDEIIEQIFTIWVSTFGLPKKFLVDKSGEFSNDDFFPFCKNANICILTTAAELH